MRDQIVEVNRAYWVVSLGRWASCQVLGKVRVLAKQLSEEQVFQGGSGKCVQGTVRMLV